MLVLFMRDEKGILAIRYSWNCLQLFSLDHIGRNCRIGHANIQDYKQKVAK